MLIQQSRAIAMVCPIMGGGQCLASACMAWRFDGLPQRRFFVADNATAVDEPKRPPRLPADWTWSPYESGDGDPAGWLEPEGPAAMRAQGYCALMARGST